MTRRRFIADDFSGDFAAVTGEHANHLARVLRAKISQEFDISTGDTVRRGTIASVYPDRVEFALHEEIATLPMTEITLLLSIYKFDRMEWAIEKCTELGVMRVIPVISRRTDAHLAAASAKRVERWQRIARQASEQSRRATPPEILTPVKLADAINSVTGRRIVLAESEGQTMLRDVLPVAGSPEIALAIGPEGGWAEDEIKAFDRAGWQSASLGQTILRAETAAIAATAIAISTLT